MIHDSTTSNGGHGWKILPQFWTSRARSSFSPQTMKTSLPLLAAIVSLSTFSATAVEPPPTKICEPVKLIAAEKFDQPGAFAAKGKPGQGGFMGGIGTWSVVDGAAFAIQEGPSQKRPNGHEAVCEHPTDLGDLIFTAEFKLGGSPQIGFVCRDTNKPNLHQGRVQVTPTAMWVQKMSGIAKETRREELQRIAVPTSTNQWHKIVIEVSGDHWRAQIGDQILDAHHERFKDRKGRVGFVARGEGAQFRNVAIWSAKPKQ
jgi:hypothetical protein